MARRHIYRVWRVTDDGGATLATGFKSKQEARAWKRTQERVGMGIRETVSYASCAKVASRDPKTFCGPCANKTPLTGESGF